MKVVLDDNKKMKYHLFIFLMLIGFNVVSQSNWSIINYYCDSIKVEIFSYNEQEIDILFD